MKQTGIVQVLSGLEAGDRVIVGNVGAIGRGVKVRVAGSTGDPSSRSGRGGRGRPGRRGAAGFVGHGFERARSES